jgi:23S rRNA pseudouridine2605 synthase
MKTEEKPRAPVAGERLQKVLAQAGIASRRAAEELIVKGRVRVDGRVVKELGTRVDRRAKIEVDGRRIMPENLVYIVLHKPREVVCTLSDPQGRPTVLELIRGAGARVVPVGRLDFHTSGALLMTNDGDFAAVLTHPRHHVPKEYVAKVRGVVDERGLEQLRKSIDIDGTPTRPAEVSVERVEGDKTWLKVVLQEGKNRQVRRLGDAAGFPVMRLVRTEHAGISTEGLRPGEWRELHADELADLKKAYGVPKRVRSPETPGVQGKELRRIRKPSKKPRDTSGDERQSEQAFGGARGERSESVRGERTERRPVRGERAQPVRGKPARAEWTEARPARGKPARGEWTEARPARGKPARGERTEARPARGKPARGEWTEARPARGKPARAERAQPVRGERTERRPARAAEGNATREARFERKPARPSARGGRESSRRRGT